MKKFLPIILIALACRPTLAQSTTKPAPVPTPPSRPTQSPPVSQQQSTNFQLSEYGVEFLADPRLIIMTAALEAAGFESATGRAPSVFRAQVRLDLNTLDPELRNRLKAFYERN